MSEYVEKLDTLNFFELASFDSDEYHESEALTKISKFTDLATVKDEEGVTLLHYASMNGWYEVVQVLVQKHSCDPNAKDKGGNTSLHAACQGASSIHVSVLNMLPERRSTPRLSSGYYYNERAFYKLCQKRRDQSKFTFDRNVFQDSIEFNAWYSSSLNIIKFLIIECHCDLLKKNKYGVTPFTLAAEGVHVDVVSFLLSAVKTSQATAQRTVGDSPLGDLALTSRINHPPNPALKVLVLGNGGAGKSTVIKTVQTKFCSGGALGSLLDRFKKVTDVELRTAGVIPIHIQSEKFGDFIMYDFAGQAEYYSSHAALLENLVSSLGTVILLAVDVSEDKAIVVRTLNYWKMFTSTTVSCPEMIPPDMVVVGTHADVARKQGEKPEQKLLDALEQANMSPQHCVVLNCTQLASSGLSSLCSVLSQESLSFSKQFSVDLQVHFVHALIKRELGDHVACRVSMIKDAGSKDENQKISLDTFRNIQLTVFPDDLGSLSQHLTTLSNLGHLLYLKNEQSIEDGWVIINKEALLSEVNGTIFAPDNFKQFHNLSNSTGVVPRSRIKKVFPKYDPDMIIEFLKYFDFCQELAKSEASLISKEHSTDASEVYYLFPALVRVERPDESCRSIEKSLHKSGWCLHCIQDDQFLSSRFLHVLLLQISFKFALSHESDEECPVVQRMCNMWKSGIHWQNRDGVEAIVEVVEQNTAVVVSIGGLEGSTLMCIQLRSQLVEMIHEVKQKFCVGAKTRELIIHPAELSFYPLKSVKDLYCFSVKEVAKTIVEGKKIVLRKKGSTQDKERIDSLLYFESYSCISPTLLAQLYKNEERKLDRTRMANLMKQLDSHPIAPKDILKRRLITYDDLKSALDKYSIFRGRNILELAGVYSQSVSEYSSDQEQEDSIDPATNGWAHSLDVDPSHVDLNTVDDSTKLDECDTTEVMDALTGLESRFYNLGLSLHLPSGKLDAIQYDYPRRCDLALSQVIKEWLCWNYDHSRHGVPSWRMLVEAVEKTSGGNNPSVAQCIAREHTLHRE